jgi:N-acetyltransferase 10
MNQLRKVNTDDESEEKIKLSAVQAAIICGMGLQKKFVEDLEKELNLPVSQILALFAKAIKRCTTFFEGLVEESVRKDMNLDVQPSEQVTLSTEKKDIEKDEDWDPTDIREELDEAEKKVMDDMKAKHRELIDSLDLQKYVYLLYLPLDMLSMELKKTGKMSRSRRMAARL